MKWWPVLAVAVVSTALAIVINFATEFPAVWALWAGVAVLTLAGAYLAHRATRPRGPAPGDPPDGGVVNTIGGDVSGTVIQARDITGGLNLPGGKDQA
ncbi:hypothetical protein [Nonomuraea sp. NPDC050643]|uniref:hypothetical protein n=1 Tax=Nonomuraea sp. NPDC050643 TaxID=3155660 RepID=UPI0033ED3777